MRTLTLFHSIASLHARMAAFVLSSPWQQPDPSSTKATLFIPFPAKAVAIIGSGARSAAHRPTAHMKISALMHCRYLRGSKLMAATSTVNMTARRPRSRTSSVEISRSGVFIRTYSRPPPLFGYYLEVGEHPATPGPRPLVWYHAVTIEQGRSEHRPRYFGCSACLAALARPS